MAGLEAVGEGRAMNPYRWQIVTAILASMAVIVACGIDLPLSLVVAAIVGTAVAVGYELGKVER